MGLEILNLLKGILNHTQETNSSQKPQLRYHRIARYPVSMHKSQGKQPETEQIL